jgi:hypothetical protein
MFRAGLENRDIQLAVLAVHVDPVVGFHVLCRDAVFVDDGAGDVLADLFLVAVLELLAGDVAMTLLSARTLSWSACWLSVFDALPAFGDVAFLATGCFLVVVIFVCTGCASCPDPVVHVLFLELPKPSDLVPWHAFASHPGVDGVLGDAKVLGDFIN